MDAIWLKNYPQGIPAEVDVHGFASLGDLLMRSCKQFGNLPVYSNMGASLNYADLDRLSRDFAAYLQQSLGLHKGDRVALMMPNLLQYPVALFDAPGSDGLPLVAGCVGWLSCRLRPESQNQQAYDLFIADVVGTWADERVFRDGRWHFDTAPEDLRTIHHVAGGLFCHRGGGAGLSLVVAGG